jgi:RNA polymerase sigma factor (sigma-70 family)
MQAMDDMTLLREYVTRNSEKAFETLVSRYIGLVHSAALRQVRDSHQAEEITQVVFAILARKADRIPEKTILSGWLFKTTRFTAIAQIRAAMKRRQREQEAHMHNELQATPEDSLWEQMSPMLDEALTSLSEKDRQVVLLRFFENKSLAEVGSRMDAGEDAARKRITRAVEKLHRFFLKRGVASTTAIIAGVIAAHSVQATPAALTQSVTAVALTKGAVAGSSTLTLIKGALKVMAWTKIKSTVVVTVAVVFLAAGTTGVVIQHQHRENASGNAAANPGFATPEAAFQSSLNAMSKGDLNALKNCYTVEFADKYMQTAGKGKSDKELAAMFMQMASMIRNAPVSRKDQTSNDSLILHIDGGRIGDVSVPMKKVDGAWKIDGNMIVDSRPTRAK